jgi:hypothetical protein
MIKKKSVIKWSKCDDCQERKEDVHETFCPYALEIENEEIDMLLCDDCVDNRYQEV